MCVQGFDDSSLHFASLIALCRALHRCETRDIRSRRVVYVHFCNFPEGIKAKIKIRRIKKCNFMNSLSEKVGRWLFQPSDQWSHRSDTYSSISDRQQYSRHFSPYLIFSPKKKTQVRRIQVFFLFPFCFFCFLFKGRKIPTQIILWNLNTNSIQFFEDGSYSFRTVLCWWKRKEKKKKSNLTCWIHTMESDK